ncbi:hypothetical protein Trydic_g14718 [Trypoxylus dichotomus]
MCRIGSIFLLITLLVTDNLTCRAILVAKTSSSGLLQGDPAPGQSPGPPTDDTLGSGSSSSSSSSFHRDVVDTEQEEEEDDEDSMRRGQNANRCSWEGNVRRLTASDDKHRNVTVEVSHRLFNTDALVLGIVYQVIIRQLRVQEAAIGEYIISSTIDGLPKGSFRSTTSRRMSCQEHVHKGQLPEYANVILNWTVEETRQFNKSNVTFTLNYRTDGRPVIYEAVYEIPITQDCQVWLKNASGEEIGSQYFPQRRDCLCWFPGPSSDHGLVVDVTRLNVPCFRGYLYFSGLNISSSPSSSSAYQQHIRGRRQTRICGKLEELPQLDRRIYFPPSHTPPFLHLRGNPVFSFNYRLVDYCYNMTFTSRNGSFDLKATKCDLRCTFKIYLPYGHRIALTLIVSGGGETGSDRSTPGVTDSIHSNQRIYQDEEVRTEKGEEIAAECDGGGAGLRFELHDGDGTVRSHCTREGDAERLVEFVSRENRLMLEVWLVKGLRGGASSTPPSLKMRYRAEPIEELTRTCDFGWVAHRQFCLTVIEEMRLPWMQAEMECGRRGGHLASVRSSDTQEVIDRMLLNSPGYRDFNAYWIGASDRMHEGDFHWSDGLPFAYANWFPGWPEHGYYNRQPNDDGLSEQDCVEVRRIYSLPTSSPNLAPVFMWNDRDCATPNYFVCERLLRDDEPLEESWPSNCNKSVTLSNQQQRAIVSSPGFPRQYPDNSDCDTDITAPAGFRIVLDFEELVLENEPSCSYDYLEIWEAVSNSSHPNNSQSSSKRLCGDWSSKLKLLRYVSKGSKLRLRFSSDYSHHYGGFKVRVSTENVMQCADDRFKVFNNSCYLFVSYPEVMWNISEEICTNIGSQLASVLTADEDHFITGNIREAYEYRTTASYWLGARTDKSGRFSWTDGNEMLFSNWVPGDRPSENDIVDGGGPFCLSTQWVPSADPLTQSGFYWKPQRCSAIGGFVCKRRRQSFEPGIDFNKTVNGSEGQLMTPNYPENYYNDLEFTIRIAGPDGTRVIVHFEKIDVEPQPECLYDYIELRSDDGDAVRYCGYHDTNMNRFDFVSTTNVAELRFHSDYSITRGGFYLRWYSADLTGCPELTLTAKEGTMQSPNYPHFLLADLDCTFVVLAPPGKRVWLEFTDFNLSASVNSYAGNRRGRFVPPPEEEAVVTVKLGYNSPLVYPYSNPYVLTEGAFLSHAERLTLKLRTKNRPVGRGFKAIYRTLGYVEEERILSIENATSGALLHLNFPDEPPKNSSLVQHIVAPIGHVISVELYNVILNSTGCSTDTSIEIRDNYADTNGTRWLLCGDNGDRSNKIFVMSYLNTLHVRQNSGGGRTGHVPLNATLKVHSDRNYFAKLLMRRNDAVESCRPNPCQHGGRCVSVGNRKSCQCQKHFTGLFCALTQCDLEPCKFGSCELTETSFKCHCKNGYTGSTCEQRRKPCQGNPCENRGVCIEKGNSFQCQCHAWWKGTRCEERMMHIPYKPLSERMLHEPFWLGLMTVTIVMGVIGLVWCAKRHFPEKIEKLLAEDEDRSRIPSLRSSSVREQLAASAAAASAGAVSATPNPGPGVPRSLFGRLGIRKSSILSLTSPHASGYSPATARTFSLDDLLKPPPRRKAECQRSMCQYSFYLRTPSPKKKRNNSTPTKKNAAEKKQILQQLVGPAASKQNSRKVSLGELIQMSERKLKDGNHRKRGGTPIRGDDIKETNLIDQKGVTDSISTGQLSLVDPKLEKKVTFARLLSKVSQEMSSGSDIELGIMQANKLSCAFVRPCSSSTPPSPGANVRSPNSTSSNQGSDSLTSSDLAIPSALSSSVSDLMCGGRRPARPTVRQKPASADSILAMFRNFSSSSAGANLPSSLRVSPSTTPTASSPQDDAAGDDESSTSSIHTPVSFSSGPPESPVLHRRSSQSTIEVPVLDPLNAHKSSSAGGNFLHPPTILLEIPSTISKCLSPIREMPTPLPSPMPSPALTPVMKRSHRHLPAAGTATAEIADDPDNSDDRISVELPNISISDEDDMHSVQDIAIDPHAEDGLILEEVIALQHGSPSATFKIKSRPSPLGQTSETTALRIPNIEVSSESPPELSQMVIPTLTIQTPSPTHKKPPFRGFAGSPPPKSQEDTFQFAVLKPSSPTRERKMLKEFDKPTSLDLPCVPPLITITCNLSEAESDSESISPAAIKTAGHLNVSSAVGMTYLSPFSMVTRGDHTASESNLSSSGYSSMASPGPSRCGSSNPLCPPEMEDPRPPGAGSTNLIGHPSALRRHTPPAPLETESATGGCANADNRQEQSDRSARARSDSETLSDDPLLESNDEGIGTDHIDEKIEDGEVKSAKELQIFINDASKKIKLDLPLITTTNNSCSAKCSSLAAEENLQKKSLQLPSIVVQYDTLSLDKRAISPVSSRSESPLSDRTGGVGRFSPQFYGGRKDLLPFTDSDGLYDFPSSDKVNVSCATQQHRKSVGRKREKKSSRTSKTPSPTKGANFSCTYHLELPKKEPTTKMHLARKASPKRRTRTQKLMSSSSSSESVSSAKELRLSSSSPSPETIRWVSSVDCFAKKTKSPEASGEETADDAHSVMLPRSDQDLYRHKKISRLRTISHQIRFLRRLEQSLKRKERTVSPTDSFNSDEDSPRATSPLLQVKEPNIEIRKSNSSGRLQSNTSYVPSVRGRHGKFRKGELLIPEHDRAWKKVVITGNGHSD